MEIIKIPLEQLTPDPHNAKDHPQWQIEQIKNSIEQFGNLDPIGVWGDDNLIVEGHGRYEALKELGYQEAECIRLDWLTEEERKAYALAHNKLTMNSGFIPDALDMTLAAIGEIDMSQFGFEIPEEEEPTEITEDEIPEKAETRCKLGDIWQLGDHRLICGDSTDPAAIDRLMDGAKAKLLLTDPPYGISVVSVDKKVGGDKPFGSKGKVGYGQKGKNKILDCNEYAPIIGDDTTDTARANYDIALTCTENQIIFGGNYFTDFLPPSRCWIVWDKQNTGNFADAELAWTSFNRGVRLYHFLWNGLCREGSREVEGKTRVHPTQKPVGMLADILKDFSEENDSILDCFGGSGSTLIACEQLNRKCYMCELDPHYCSVIIQRWENLTGEKAVRINDAG